MRSVGVLVLLASLVLAVACGGGSREQQPEVIATLRATASPTPTPAPTAVPATATATATVKPSATPLPTDTPGPSPNQSPSFPGQPLAALETNYDYDDEGALIGAVTTMTAPAATDPDGDQLTYSWSVTTGTITSAGLQGTWVRAIADGQEAPGKVTVTASDGRSGSANFVVDFQ